MNKSNSRKIVLILSGLLLAGPAFAGESETKILLHGNFAKAGFELRGVARYITTKDSLLCKKPGFGGFGPREKKEAFSGVPASSCRAWS